MVAPIPWNSASVGGNCDCGCCGGTAAVVDVGATGAGGPSVNCIAHRGQLSTTPTGTCDGSKTYGQLGFGHFSMLLIAGLFVGQASCLSSLRQARCPSH